MKEVVKSSFQYTIKQNLQVLLFYQLITKAQTLRPLDQVTLFLHLYWTWFIYKYFIYFLYAVVNYQIHFSHFQFTYVHLKQNLSILSCILQNSQLSFLNNSKLTLNLLQLCFKIQPEAMSPQVSLPTNDHMLQCVHCTKECQGLNQQENNGEYVNNLMKHL